MSPVMLVDWLSSSFTNSRDSEVELGNVGHEAHEAIFLHQSQHAHTYKGSIDLHSKPLLEVRVSLPHRAEDLDLTPGK